MRSRDERAGRSPPPEQTHDILAVILQAVQNQSSQQKDRIQNATLDRIPDHTPVEGVHAMVRGELCAVLSLFDSPDDETGDDDVGNEWDGEEGWSDGDDSRGEGRLAGGEVGEFPDGHADQCFMV